MPKRVQMTLGCVVQAVDEIENGFEVTLKSHVDAGPVMRSLIKIAVERAEPFETGKEFNVTFEATGWEKESLSRVQR